MISNLSFEMQNALMSYKHGITYEPCCNLYSLHTHNWYELIYFVSGNATHVIEDRKYKIKPGDIILVRPLKSHFIQIDSSETYERFSIRIDDPLLRERISLLFDTNFEVVNLPKESGVEEILYRIDHYRQNLSDKEME